MNARAPRPAARAGARSAGAAPWSCPKALALLERLAADTDSARAASNDSARVSGSSASPASRRSPRSRVSSSASPPARDRLRRPRRGRTSASARAGSCSAAAACRWRSRAPASSGRMSALSLLRIGPGSAPPRRPCPRRGDHDLTTPWPCGPGRRGTPRPPAETFAGPGSNRSSSPSSRPESPSRSRADVVDETLHAPARPRRRPARGAHRRAGQRCPPTRLGLLALHPGPRPPRRSPRSARPAPRRTSRPADSRTPRR